MMIPRHRRSTVRVGHRKRNWKEGEAQGKARKSRQARKDRKGKARQGKEMPGRKGKGTKGQETKERQGKK
jgi:hypothetical protein